AMGRSLSPGESSVILGIYGQPAPLCAIAIPLVVRGKAAAILYVDSGTQSEHSINTAAIETLMCVTSMAIELLPARRAWRSFVKEEEEDKYAPINPKSLINEEKYIPIDPEPAGKSMESDIPRIPPPPPAPPITWSGDLSKAAVPIPSTETEQRAHNDAR